METNKIVEGKLSTDVLIIGSGGSGLPAAVAAANAGVSVAVIDKRNNLGGSARIPAGVFALESPAQRRQGIFHPTIDEYFKIHMDYANWLCEGLLVRNWLKATGDIIKWLEEKGLEFSVSRTLSGSMKTLHQVVSQTVNTGNAIVNILIREATSKGVKFYTNTKATKMILDDNGNVTGVLADHDGREVTISAKSIIVGTGSMSKNDALRKKFLPHVDFENIPIMQLPFSTGDGYELVMAAGGAKDGQVSPLWIGPCTHPHNTRISNIVRRPHVMWVNKNGMRYADESLWSLSNYGWWAGIALDKQPGRVSWGLIDHTNLRNMINKKETVNGMEEIYGRITSRKFKDIESATDRENGIAANEEIDPTSWLDEIEQDVKAEANEGRILISNSLVEIAEWIGADPEVLKSQVEKYNNFCKNGYDDDFLKPKEWLLPLKTPPYYAIKAHQALDTISGGIRINHRMEVMKESNLEPIGGLYAGGIACSGWFGVAGEAAGGCAISFSLFSGFEAGKNAAAFIKRK